MSRRKRKQNHNRPLPPSFPPEVDRLRDARKAIEPWRVYRLKMPDGTVVEATGAQLIREADNMMALASAQRRGDEAGMRRALLRIEHDIEGSS